MSTAEPITLKPSRDRKVSPLSRWAPAAKRWEPMIANSFGTTPGPIDIGGTCNGATEWCKGVCYVCPLSRAFPTVGRLLAHNTEVTTQKASVQVAALTALVSAFVAESEKVSRRTGRVVPLVYRINWSGDLRDRVNAAAWAEVCKAFPQVTFWLYTRSFWVVDLLAGIPNLSVYLSVDAFNVDAAQECHSANPFTRLAFCGDTWGETETLAEKFPTERKGPRCPELTGKLPMVIKQADGYGVGACVECGLCIFGRNNVRFAGDH